MVVLDEAQRIKNRESKTAQVVRGISPRPQLGHDRHADREPLEDLVNIFAFVDPEPHPAGHAGQAAAGS